MGPNRIYCRGIFIYRNKNNGKNAIFNLINNH